MEDLLWFPGDKEFVKSFREGSRLSLLGEVVTMPAGLVQGSALTGGSGFIRKDGAPSYAEVLRSAASLSAAEKATMRLGDPLGKDLSDVENLLGLTLFDAKPGSAGEGRLIGKGKTHALLWEWKGHLMKLKAEVDRALLEDFHQIPYSISRRFLTIFLIFREQNYFLLPYKKILHNRFPYISLYQLNIIFLLLFYSFSLFPSFSLFSISINYTSFILK
jgi:hypothetical protein